MAVVLPTVVGGSRAWWHWDSTHNTILVAMEQWNVQHRAFVIETFFKSGTWFLKHRESFVCILTLTVMEKCLVRIQYCYG